MSLVGKIDRNRVPQHVAIIMDGNGRWAKKMGAQRIFGHKSAVNAVQDAVQGSIDAGVKYLTLFAFSTENWSRPQAEVESLMELLANYIDKEGAKLSENNVRLKTIGDLSKMPSFVVKRLRKLMDDTANNTGLTVVLAVSYSSRWEIVDAVKRISLELKNGRLDPDAIDEKVFSSFLNTSDIPDPELLIRTSGEYRISNFLLWQIAYGELFFTDKLWPDFRKEDFFEAIIDFQNRERRFGKTSEQL